MDEKHTPITPQQAIDLWDVTKGKRLVATKDHKIDGLEVPKGTSGGILELPKDGRAVVGWEMGKEIQPAWYDAKTLPEHAEIQNLSAKQMLHDIFDHRINKETAQRYHRDYSELLQARVDRHSLGQQGRLKDSGRER